MQLQLARAASGGTYPSLLRAAVTGEEDTITHFHRASVGFRELGLRGQVAAGGDMARRGIDCGPAAAAARHLHRACAHPPALHRWPSIYRPLRGCPPRNLHSANNINKSTQQTFLRLFSTSLDRPTCRCSLTIITKRRCSTAREG